MKLTRAQVKNFRSIEDSGEFKFDEHATCLVGKNEAGKTALLTALYRLQPIFDAEAKFDRQKDYPRRYRADYEERHNDEDPELVARMARNLTTSNRHGTAPHPRIGRSARCVNDPL